MDPVTLALAKRYADLRGVPITRFGAKGDGATDDTAAIQAALDSGEKCIIVPPGTYLTDTLTVPSGVTLVGMSKSESVLQLVNNPSGALLDISGASGAVNVKENITISNLTLKHREGYDNQGVLARGSLLRGYYTRWITVDNVVFANFSTHGIIASFIDNNDTDTESWVVSRCRFLDGPTGIGVYARTEAEYMVVTDCWFQRVGSGYVDHNAGNGRITGCTFLRCGNDSLSMPVVEVTYTTGNGGKFLFVGNVVNHFTYKGLIISTSGSSQRGCIISSNQFRINESRKNHLEIIGSKQNIVMGNQFSTAGGASGEFVLIVDSETAKSDKNIVVNNVLIGPSVLDDSTGDNIITPNIEV